MFVEYWNPLCPRVRQQDYGALSLEALPIGLHTFLLCGYISRAFESKGDPKSTSYGAREFRMRKIHVWEILQRLQRWLRICLKRAVFFLDVVKWCDLRNSWDTRTHKWLCWPIMRRPTTRPVPYLKLMHTSTSWQLLPLSPKQTRSKIEFMPDQLLAQTPQLLRIRVTCRMVHQRLLPDLCLRKESPGSL